MNNRLKKKDCVLFACNEGGHYSQMMALAPLFKNFNSILVTDNTRINEKIPPLNYLSKIEFALGIANKRKSLSDSMKNLNRFSYASGYLKMFYESFIILLKHRPKVIISTGSNLAVPFIIFGRIMGSKTVYIESRAKVNSRNMSGILVKPFCHKIIVQWPEMLNLYGKKAEYHGILI